MRECSLLYKSFSLLQIHIIQECNFGMYYTYNTKDDVAFRIFLWYSYYPPFSVSLSLALSLSPSIFLSISIFLQPLYSLRILDMEDVLKQECVCEEDWVHSKSSGRWNVLKKSVEGTLTMNFCVARDVIRICLDQKICMFYVKLR